MTLLEDPTINQNVRQLKGTVDVVVGGPPCQGFSVGGRRNGQDIRNDLVFRMLDVVELLCPKIVLIENVEGITRRFISRPGRKSDISVADQVTSRLTEMGYKSSYKVLDVSEFGVPQTRKRAVIIGIQDTEKLDAEDFFSTLDSLRQRHLNQNNLPNERKITAKEALDDLHNPAENHPSKEWPKFQTTNYKEPASQYARLMRSHNSSNKTPDSHRFANHTQKIKSLFELAHKTQPAGRLSRRFLEDNNCKSDKKVLIDPDEPMSTVTSHPDEFIHYAEPRIITVREMARIQSFPDNFHFYGRYTINGDRRGHDVSRCVQVGNAVPPLFAEALGMAVKEILNG